MKINSNKFNRCVPTFILILFTFLLSFASRLSGNNENKADSIRQLLSRENKDTSRIKLLNALALEVCKTDMDSAIVICRQIIDIAEKINDKENAARAYNFCGTLYFLKSDYPSGIKAQFAALKYAEEAKMDKFSGQILVSVGNVFMMQGDYAKSLEYYKKAFGIFERIHDQDNSARIYSNIGLVYAYQKQSTKALEYFRKSLHLRKEAPNESEKAITYDFIGFAYMNEQNYEKAIAYLDTSLAINRKLNSTIRIIDNLRNRGESYFKLKRYSSAEKDLKESLELSKKHGHLNGQEGNNDLLYQLYKITNRPELAFNYYKDYVLIKDSIYNVENTGKTLRQEMNFEYSKKAAADSVRVAEEKKIVAVQLKKEQTQRYALYGGLVLLGLFAVFIGNRFRITREQRNVIASQKRIVEQQKAIVEEKQKEVLDSIHYARRIQQSLLASDAYINRHVTRLKGE